MNIILYSQEIFVDTIFILLYNKILFQLKKKKIRNKNNDVLWNFSVKYLKKYFMIFLNNYVIIIKCLKHIQQFFETFFSSAKSLLLKYYWIIILSTYY